jgi:hypothetical protein
VVVAVELVLQQLLYLVHLQVQDLVVLVEQD